MIYTSYFAMVRNMPSSITPVSIARWLPKFFDGASAIEAAPSVELLRNYKNGIVGDHEYEEIYTSETLKPLDINAFVDHLSKIAGVPDVSTNKSVHVALCCYEKNGDFCHRHLLADHLTKHGVLVREVTKEELKDLLEEEELER